MRQSIAISLGCSAAFNSKGPVKYGIAEKKQSPKSQPKSFERYLSESSMRQGEQERRESPRKSDQLGPTKAIVVPQKSAVKAAINPVSPEEKTGEEHLFNLENFRN